MCKKISISLDLFTLFTILYNKRLQMEIFQFLGRNVPPTCISARLVQTAWARRKEAQDRIIDYEKWIEPMVYENKERWDKELAKHPERPIYLGIYFKRYRVGLADCVDVMKTVLHTLQLYNYFPDDKMRTVIPVFLGQSWEWKHYKCGFICCILPPSYKEDISGILGL